MRALNPRHRCGHAADHDRGAVVVWCMLMVVALVGSGALVVDMGALYHERRQLQNGADAAALAVAVDCARLDCKTPMTVAQTYANANAKDGASAVETVCGKASGLVACATTPAGAAGAPNYVHVVTRTRNPANTANPDQVRFALAPILDAASVGSTVRARSTVAWGPSGSADLVPLAMSQCAFQAAGGTLDSAGKIATFPTGMAMVISYDPQDGIGCFGPGGQALPGGFGWLAPTSPCKVHIQITGSSVMVGNDPGKSFEQTCRDQFLAWASPGNSETFFLPMYDQAVGTGNNGQYRIVGLAAFDLCGYRFPGISNSGNECRAAQGCNGPSNRGYICGYFRAKAVTDGGWGTGKDFGLRTVKVVG